MRYRKDTTSPLMLNETEIKEAITEYLQRRRPEEAKRIKHVTMDVQFDEHSYVPVGANVYLRDPGPNDDAEIVVLDEDVEGLGKRGDQVRITSSGAERLDD